MTDRSHEDKNAASDMQRIIDEIEAPDPWTWWYRFVAVSIMAMMLFVGLGLLFGPTRWSTGNSIAIIHYHANAIPVKMYSIPFLLAGVLIVFEVTRLWAYMIGFAFGSFFVLASALLTVLGNHSPPSAYNNHRTLANGTRPPMIPIHVNIIVVGFSILGLELLLSGMRFVIDDRRHRQLVADAERTLAEL